MQFSKSFLFTALALVAPIAMQANLIVPSPTLNVGGLTFSNFTCSIMSSGSIVLPLNCGGIAVNTITTPGVGIEFDASNFLAGNNSANDIRINYTVTSPTPITTVGLDFNAIYAGLAVSSVTEELDNTGGTQVGFMSVSVGAAALGGSNLLWSSTSVNGSYTTLNIQKDINLTATANSSAQESYIQQVFVTAAPEPGSTALMGAGLMLCGLALRRRFSQKQVA
jgi:hypothetical protein